MLPLSITFQIRNQIYNLIKTLSKKVLINQFTRGNKYT